MVRLVVCWQREAMSLQNYISSWINHEAPSYSRIIPNDKLFGSILNCIKNKYVILQIRSADVAR